MTPDTISPVGFETMSPAMACMSLYPRYLYRTLMPALGHRIIEIGVGYGTYTEWLLSHGHVLATDIAVECLEQVKTRVPHARLQTQVIDLTDQASVGRCVSFNADTVFCVNVLEHIEHDVHALRCLRQVVVPNGQLALLVPAHEWLYGSMDRQAGHFRRYSRASLTAVATKAGWHVNSVFYINALGALGWWWHNRVRGASLTDETANRQMKAADIWLPRLASATDGFLGRLFGLSVVLFARNTECPQK